MITARTHDGIARRTRAVGVALCLSVSPSASSAEPPSAVVRAQAEASGEQPRGGPLTEQAAVARALERAGVSDLAQQARGVGQAAAMSATAWPNPSIGWTREHLLGSGGSNEDAVVVSQEIDLSGSRSLRASAAERRAEADALDAEALARGIEREVRLAFYDVLAAQATVQAAADWTAALERALDVVTRREQQGESSTLERLRLERELRNASARRAEREATLAAAQARLAGWVGEEHRDLGPLSGALFDASTPGGDAAALVERPEVRAIEARSEAAALEQRAAERAWVPAFAVAAGYKTAEAGGERQHGYVVGLELSLPLFDRKQGDAARAEAEQRLLAAERALLLARETADLVALAAEARRLHAAAVEFQQELGAGGDRLLTAAEAGWKGGAITILDLVDVYRSMAEDAERAAAIAHAARRAQVMLDAVTGVKP